MKHSNTDLTAAKSKIAQNEKDIATTLKAREKLKPALAALQETIAERADEIKECVNFACAPVTL